MKKFCIIFLIFVFYHFALHAQPENEVGTPTKDSIEYNYAFLNLGVFPKWSTNGKNSENYTNNISVNLVYGESQNIYGLSISPIASYTKNKSYGIHIGGIVNAIDGGGSGLAAGFFNRIGDSYKGVAIGGFNGVKYMKGLQIGAGNSTLKASGVQIGIASMTENMKGLQIGMMNEADTLSGVQIGLFNTRKRSGIQIGFINESDNNLYPIGIVNIIKNGEMFGGLSLDETGSLKAEFRSGSRRLYGLIGYGYCIGSNNKLFAIDMGIGAHLNLHKRIRVDFELVQTIYSKAYVDFGEVDEETKESRDFKTAYKTGFRILPNIKVSNKIRVYGGPSFNYMLAHDNDNTDIFPSKYRWRKFEGTSLKQIHIGYSIGINYQFR